MSKLRFIVLRLKFLGVDIILNYFFNSGRFLGIIFFFQVLTGLILIFYFSITDNSFKSLQYLIYEVKNGWLLRLIHFNGANILFIFLYLHFLKALIYKSYKLIETWFLGILILLFFYIEAFLGYSLVIAQISYWARTVISSLLIVIPIFGELLVFWIWGDFFVRNNTIKFFFLLHFILPFLLIFIIILHIYFLHFYTRRSKLNFIRKQIKFNFYPFYWIKDMLNLIIFILIIVIILYFPFNLSDSLIFEELNKIISPIHIVPEWYFTWVYAILRSIPNKIIGVIIIIISILLFLMFIFKKNFFEINIKRNKFFIIILLFIYIFLRWLGILEALEPYVKLRNNIIKLYFLILFILIIF